MPDRCRYIYWASVVPPIYTIAMALNNSTAELCRAGHLAIYALF